MVLGKNIAHDMKSGAEGAHFFGALLLTFSFDKHSQRLETHFEQMKNKLPVEPVKDQEKDFFRNRRGAKVYHDVDRQPILELTKGKNAFVVLSVGIAKGGIPLVTVEASPENLCYRLPVQLWEWAITLVSLANAGEDLFPAEVIFTKAENRIYADII